MDIVSRLQPHTVQIYHLENGSVEERVMTARQLLSPSRFDLFAKLYYIRNREHNKEEALKVYKEHIKAFNPDLKEPGRDDKSGYEDFITAFDRLIECFTSEDFDSSVSLVPVTDDNVILDGAHRVAALAYYDKSVGVALCRNIVPKADFDYRYFKHRGTSWETMDLIANEMVGYLPDVRVACVWPRVTDKSFAVSQLRTGFKIIYEKSVLVSMQSFRELIARVYANQPWSNHPDSLNDKAMQCFGFNREVVFVFFVAERQADVPAVKETIRDRCGVGKHSVHITDSADETRAIAAFVLLEPEYEKWNKKTRTNRFLERMKERWFYCKTVRLINLKVAVARVLRIGK